MPRPSDAVQAGGETVDGNHRRHPAATKQPRQFVADRLMIRPEPGLGPAGSFRVVDHAVAGDVHTTGRGGNRSRITGLAVAIDDKTADARQNGRTTQAAGNSDGDVGGPPVPGDVILALPGIQPQIAIARRNQGRGVVADDQDIGLIRPLGPVERVGGIAPLGKKTQHVADYINLRHKRESRDGLTRATPFRIFRPPVARPGIECTGNAAEVFVLRICTMKIRNSLKSAKLRDKNCRIVRRKGRVYVINKTNPRFKARQG